MLLYRHRNKENKNKEGEQNEGEQMKNKIEDKNYKKRFLNGFKLLCGKRSSYEVWSDCMSLFAITLLNSAVKASGMDGFKDIKQIWDEREQEYLRIINKYDRKEQKLFPQMFALLVKEMELHPNQDLLGEIYMMAEISNKNNGQFFTPYGICELMSKVALDKKQIGKEVHKKGYASVCDCACGAGALLISAVNQCKEMFKKLNWQNHIYVVGQDIDITCVHMCYIQLSLLGCAGYVIHGNTLTEPEPKDLKQIWFTPLWFSNVWAMRRLAHGQDILGREIKHETK